MNSQYTINVWYQLPSFENKQTSVLKIKVDRYSSPVTWTLTDGGIFKLHREGKIVTQIHNVFLVDEKESEE